MVCSLTLCFLAASATEVRSHSRRIATICSSVNRLLRIGSSLAKEPFFQKLTDRKTSSGHWGFWKCRDRLRAQGYGWNHKRVWRVYCQLRLNLLRRTRRRVPQRVRQPLLVEPRMNAVWAIDFMRDTLYSGRVFRTLNVIDEANRGALGIDLAVSIPAARVITFLTQ